MESEGKKEKKGGKLKTGMRHSSTKSNPWLILILLNHKDQIEADQLNPS